MNKMIVMTGWGEGKTLAFSTDHIEAIGEEGAEDETWICAGGRKYYVKETPEEIFEAIAEVNRNWEEFLYGSQTTDQALDS